MTDRIFAPLRSDPIKKAPVTARWRPQLNRDGRITAYVMSLLLQRFGDLVSGVS
jgi:hypothetical protein